MKFSQCYECTRPIGVDENTSISYANQRVQNEDPALATDASDSCTRQALLYLAGAVTV